MLEEVQTSHDTSQYKHQSDIDDHDDIVVVVLIRKLVSILDQVHVKFSFYPCVDTEDNHLFGVLNSRSLMHKLLYAIINNWILVDNLGGQLNFTLE